MPEIPQVKNLSPLSQEPLIGPFFGSWPKMLAPLKVRAANTVSSGGHYTQVPSCTYTSVVGTLSFRYNTPLSHNHDSSFCKCIQQGEDVTLYSEVPKYNLHLAFFYNLTASTLLLSFAKWVTLLPLFHQFVTTSLWPRYWNLQNHWIHNWNSHHDNQTRGI